MRIPGFGRIGRGLRAFRFYFYNHVVGRLPGYGLRHAYLRRVLGYEIADGAAVHMGCFVTGETISIGPRSVVNRGCYLDGRGGLTLGADVSVSPQCYLLTLTHDVRDPGFGAVPGPVVLADRSWLGVRAVVLPGRTVGRGAVVGAAAVVTKDVPPLEIVAGNPARPVGRRPAEPTHTLHWKPWFDTDLP